MKQKKFLLFLFTIGCATIIILTARQLGTYKYSKENSNKNIETETADSQDTVSDHNIALGNESISNNTTALTTESISSNTTTLTNESISGNALVSTEPQTTLEGDSAMVNPDRVIYHEGFYYEPISEEVKKRIYGLSYKEDCTVPYEDLRYVSVLYKNFDNETAYGELICNKAIAHDLVEIFYELFKNDYQIEKIRLIDEYSADDDISCQENNTSCFNYRVVAGSTKLSKHALGLAIDINPFYNPYVTYPDGVERISPPGSEPYADRDADLPHMIQKGDLIYNLFIERGFTWGGEWNSLKDYQHFQKAID